MKTATYKITGMDAVRLAERDSLTVYCGDLTDGGGAIGMRMARQIVKRDPDLIYVTVAPRGWWDGERMLSEMEGYNVSDYFTSGGMYLGPDDDGVEPRWDDAGEEIA